jgi:hypothetical protein
MRARYLLLVAFVHTFILGCAASIPQSYILKKEQSAGVESSVTVVDVRRPEDKLMQVQEDPSILIVHYGDGDFSADRIELLRYRLQKELGQSGKPVRVEVSRFSSSVSRTSIGMSMGSGPVRPGTYWIVTRPDGAIPASYAGASVAGNAIATAAINSEWFRGLPSTRASLSVLIQGEVDGVAFLGNDSDNVKAGELAEAMPRVIDGAIRAAVRDIKRKIDASK